MRRPFVAGNWKLNKTPSEAAALAREVRRLVASVRGVDIAIAPTMVSLNAASDAVRDTNVQLAAQNVFWESGGAFTGEVSASMLKDVGCTQVIIGHSERRTYFGETNATVAKRVRAALDEGLNVILCIGETLEEREGNRTMQVVKSQLLEGLETVKDDEHSNITVAYEPVWAIGTGRTASPEQAQEVHAFLRGQLTSRFDSNAAQGIRIQYGGSVKPANAAELLTQPDIDGALVGGASLKADAFAAIVKVAQATSA